MLICSYPGTSRESQLILRGVIYNQALGNFSFSSCPKHCSLPCGCWTQTKPCRFNSKGTHFSYRTALYSAARCSITSHLVQNVLTSACSRGDLGWGVRNVAKQGTSMGNFAGFLLLHRALAHWLSLGLEAQTVHWRSTANSLYSCIYHLGKKCSWESSQNT